MAYPKPCKMNKQRIYVENFHTSLDEGEGLLPLITKKTMISVSEEDTVGTTRE